MKSLLPLLLVLAACAPKPVKVYTEVGIGMSRSDFDRICGIMPNNSERTTNASSETLVLTNGASDFNGAGRSPQCVGRFTFINDKLDTIAR